MSTPKIAERSSSFVVNRQHSNRNLRAIERNYRENDESFVKKRFKVQPYSSFEDKFIEQERINRGVWEQISRIDAKIKEIPGNGEIERVYSAVFALQEKVQGIYLDFNRKAEGFAEFEQLKEFINRELVNDQMFKGKSSEKNKVLFEEVVRIGQLTESNDKTLQVFHKKSNKNLKNITAKSIETDKRLLRVEENLAKLIKNASMEEENLSKLTTMYTNLKSDLESYSSSLSLSLNQASEAVQERLLQEQETRQKSNTDLKSLLTLTSEKLIEKFSADLSSLSHNFIQSEKSLKTGLLSQTESLQLLSNNFESFTINTQQNHFNILKRMEEITLFVDESNKEMQKTLENLKKDIFRTEEKIHEALVMEIDVRTQAERELKYMIEVTSKDIYMEINDLRLKDEALGVLILEKISETRVSIAEKYEVLSKYVDAEVKKIADLINATTENYKDLFPQMVEKRINMIMEEVKENNKKIGEEVKENNKKIGKEVKSKQAELVKAVNNKVRSLHDHVEVNVKSINKAFESSKLEIITAFNEQKQFIQNIILNLDKKICDIDDSLIRDFKEISDTLEVIEKEIDLLSEKNNDHIEVIAQLETQIDLKLVNEKVSREHMVDLYKQSIYEEFDRLFNKVKYYSSLSTGVNQKLLEVDERCKEVSRAFDSFRENIKAETAEFFEQAQLVKEKIEVSEVIIDEIKDKLSELQESNTKIRLMFKYTMKQQEEKNLLIESANVVNDLTNRVESINILSKLDQIFKDMDDNERETEAMLVLYKRELEYIQERQKKGLIDAQSAVFEIFDKKVQGLQQMIVTEMNNVIEYMYKNRPQMPNLGGLQEFANKLKIIEPQP